jgi:4-hydroxy-tetrahydrodipicolinate reductase
MTDLKIGVVGGAGRMGQNLLRAIGAAEGAAVGGAMERPGHERIGQDLASFSAAAPGLVLGDDADALFAACDAVMDFTIPAASMVHAGLAAKHGTIHILGTTGFEAHEQAVVVEASADTAIVQAANFSLGVNILLALVERAAASLGPDFDIEVFEMHHNQKIDAPSGTALAMGKAAAAGRGVDHDTVADRGRDGITGARKRGDIGYASLRGGNVAGEHNVIFAAEDERIELGHKATDRYIFARGAVQAALWAQGKAPGLYTMRDVLGL